MCEVSFSLGYYGFLPFEFLALFLITLFFIYDPILLRCHKLRILFPSASNLHKSISSKCRYMCVYILHTYIHLGEKYI